MQTIDHVFKLAAVAAALAVVVTGCNRSERQEVRQETKQATNAAATTVDNAALTTKVKAALLADELVKGTQINVESDNGVVTLLGSVDSAAHKDRAEQVAKGVSGVTRVQNNLTAGPAATTSPVTTAPTTSSKEPPPAAVAVPPVEGKK